MVTGSAAPTEVQASAPRRTRTWDGRAEYGGRPAGGPASALARYALTFALCCHAGQRRESDGASFIEHPLEVERLLRDAGCADDVAAAGLLHDVVEDADVSVAELTAHFGETVASLVRAVSDDACVHGYRERKRMLRERVRSAGGDAALLFAAEQISKVRELPDQIRRDQARLAGSRRESRVRARIEQAQQMRLEHYEQSLKMLQGAARRHPLVTRLADELERCTATISRDARSRRRASPPRDPARSDSNQVLHL